ncbi:hypothetical protein QJS10_CPB20g00201 [Acorus calamus]|uniref:Pentatricopeptide repeat-containing protein n=1 Tax=Acorus calamus TaxID=4465 RepID=A0AAV9CAI4_ACOCL|nr:hypothetical protein QJS10_CPB20g00201 [Acorus calamus]
MVVTYAAVGDLEEAIVLFMRMPERNVMSWNPVIDEYARARESQRRGNCLIGCQNGARSLTMSCLRFMLLCPGETGPPSTRYFFASAATVDEVAGVTYGPDLFGELFTRDSKAFTEAVLYGVLMMMSSGRLP